MTSKVAVALLVSALCLGAGASRIGLAGQGRQLLTTTIGPTSTPFTLSAMAGHPNTGSNDPCYIFGYPGAHGDSTLQAPLNVPVPVGEKLVISFRNDDTAYFQYLGASGDRSTGTFYPEAGPNSPALSSITAGPAYIGQTFSAITGLFYANPANSTGAQRSCEVVINYTGVASSSAPGAAPPSPYAG